LIFRTLLDIDTVLGAAPGAKIAVYGVPLNALNTSLQTPFDAMINGGLKIISNS